MIDGLTRIDSEKAMRLAIEDIKTAKYMKVIGMGRQDVAEASSKNHVRDYYKAIEDRFKDSERPFSLRRVTQHVLKPVFKNHLKECFQILDSQGNKSSKYDLVLYGDLKITYTYYIIRNEDENTSLYLTLNTENLDLDRVDHSLVFHSRNAEIIDKFSEHFDQFWMIESKQGRRISDLRNFDRFVPFDGPLYNQYTEIKHIIKRIPDDSVRMKHLKKEMDIFHRRLKGLDACDLTYRHSNKNQRVTDCFIDYITDLRDGKKSYRTISIASFWESMYHVSTFLEKQAIALEKDAVIERILLIDSTKLDEYQSNGPLQIAITRNYLHHKKYTNYCFSILFSTDVMEMNFRDNYAIWNDEDIDYKVLFKMQYDRDSGGSTTLLFANYSLNEATDMRKNQDKINEAESNFAFMKIKVKEQNQEFIEFLEKSKKVDSHYSIESKEIQRKIEFLLNCGIDDIDFFFKNCTIR